MEVVLAAVVTAISAIVVALIARGVFDRFKKNIGKANGRGTIVQMNEEQLDMLERMESSVANVEQHRQTAEARMKELTAAVAAVNFNMQQITRFQNLVTGVRLDFEARFEEINRRLENLDDRLERAEAQVGARGRTYTVPSLPSRTIDTDVNE